MNLKKFWKDLKIGLAGPNYWRQRIERKQRDDQIVHKLMHIRPFIAATSQITQSEVGQQWADDCLREIDELIRMHSHDD